MDNRISFPLNVLDFHIQSRRMNKENKVYSDILPFEISFQKLRFTLSGSILQFYVTVDSLSKHHIPRMECSLGELGESVSPVIPGLLAVLERTNAHIMLAKTTHPEVPYYADFYMRLFIFLTLGSFLSFLVMHPETVVT